MSNHNGLFNLQALLTALVQLLTSLTMLMTLHSMVPLGQAGILMHLLMTASHITHMKDGWITAGMTKTGSALTSILTSAVTRHLNSLDMTATAQGIAAQAVVPQKLCMMPSIAPHTESLTEILEQVTTRTEAHRQLQLPYPEMTPDALLTGLTAGTLTGAADSRTGLIQQVEDRMIEGMTGHMTGVMTGCTDHMTESVGRVETEIVRGLGTGTSESGMTRKKR